MEPDDLEIGSRCRRVSTNKQKELVCDADIAEYQGLCQQYHALPDKLVVLNVDSTKWSSYKTTHETSALPICMICNKSFNAPKGNYVYHLKTFHPLLYNAIAVNSFIQNKPTVLEILHYNHVLFSIPCLKRVRVNYFVLVHCDK